MDEKTVAAADPKRAIKESKKKKKQPLKVVYITNPIKFTASASEFRALVQELTGQDSKFAEADKGGLVHAAAQVVGAGGGGPDLISTSGGSTTYVDDGCFCSPEMIDNFQGMEASRLWHDDEQDVHLDVFKRLGAM